MGALQKAATFGDMLLSRLKRSLSIDSNARIVEVGGGYGTLMGRLLNQLPNLKVTMIELSPRFAALQREALTKYPGVSVVEGDVFEVLGQSNFSADLLISNENIGDFPTAEGLLAEEIAGIIDRGTFDGSIKGRVARLIDRYQLPLPEDDRPFAFNLGALEYVEMLKGRTNAAFISEHSADIELKSPWGEFLNPTFTGRPRRIELKGHAEYSIRFGDLERAAVMDGWNVERFPMVELLGVRHDAGARFMAGAECVGNERAEIIHEFLNHVKEYECLILKR